MNTRLPSLPLLLTGLLAAVAALPAAAQVQAGRELVRLDPKNLVHEVAINSTVATTITFPEKINLLTGFGLITQPSDVNEMAAAKVAVVHYQHVMGDTVVVRLVKPGEPCHATIRTTRNIYLMRFSPAEEAHLAVIVAPPVARDAAAPVSSETIAEKRLKFDSEELVGMLSKARNRKALQPLNPSLYNGWQERNALDMVTTQDQLVTAIYEIQRNPAKDLTIFRCRVTNNGAEPYEFEPAGTKVRVGGRSYDTQLVDCAPVIPAGQRAAMDIILQGGPGGSREGLSINQDFRIELPGPGRRNPLLPAPGDLEEAFLDGK